MPSWIYKVLSSTCRLLRTSRYIVFIMFLHTTGVISISHAIHLWAQQWSPPQFFCPYLITSYLYQSVGLDINLYGIIIIILREPLFTIMSVTFNIYSMSMYVLGIEVVSNQQDA